MIGCIILTHGELGFGLQNTLEGIMGKQEGLSVISNTGLGKEELFSALQKKISQEIYDEGVVIFVDMFGTSCWQTAKKVASGLTEYSTSNLHNKPKIRVITGVNLPMLVKFFSLRESISLSEIVPLIQQAGEKGIRAES